MTHHHFSKELELIRAQADTGQFFWRMKRLLDVATSLMLLPLLVCFIILLFLLNPFFNPGGIFYSQIRMGRDCRAFKLIKFRTMRADNSCPRKFNDPLEVSRITKLGRLMRKSRIDELPQILNVLKGEMSLIGPRPDFFSHGRVYVRTVIGYRDRYRVRPGISGLAQVQLGYAEGTDATVSKTR